MSDRFPPPWTVHHNDDAYWVESANGARFAFCYFREYQRSGSGEAGFLTRDGARRIASNVAKLPAMLAGARTKIELDCTDQTKVAGASAFGCVEPACDAGPERRAMPNIEAPRLQRRE